MKHFFILLVFILELVSCKEKMAIVDSNQQEAKPSFDFLISFGSCNKVEVNNVFWDDIVAENPDLWIWGGDNIYASTVGFSEMAAMYDEQNKVENYALLKTKIPVIGTWDDHDYGLNDGGVEFEMKEASQQLFLDFLDVPKESSRRKQKGIYTSHEFDTGKGTIKIMVLDTRYFRSQLVKSNDPGKRYEPSNNPDATILGEEQWKWLQQELNASEADFNILVSSIQFLSWEHGFETWGNFPREVDKMKKIISESGAKGVLFLSGDRHISEFSKTELPGLSYPIIDFTSSGLTHSYSEFKGEPNQYRIGSVVNKPSYGILGIIMDKKEVHFRIMGENGTVLQELKQRY